LPPKNNEILVHILPFKSAYYLFLIPKGIWLSDHFLVVLIILIFLITQRGHLYLIYSN
jgi:hypothetical protein